MKCKHWLFVSVTRSLKLAKHNINNNDDIFSICHFISALLAGCVGQEQWKSSRVHGQRNGRWNKRAVLYLDSISPFTLEPSVDWHFCPLLTSTSVYRIIVHQPQSAGSVGITQYSGLVWNSGGMARRSATVSSGFTCEKPGAAGAAGKGSLPWPRGRVQTYAHSQSQSALQQLCVDLTRVHWHMSSGTVL